MENNSIDNDNSETPPIYIISGGSGACGEQLAETVLVQFPNVKVPIIKKTYIRRAEQIDQIMDEVSRTNGIVIHTLVETDLRNGLVKTGKLKNAMTVDLMGPLFKHLTKTLNQKPVEQPGLYRELHKSYFDRVDAIEFALTHDDGKNTQDLHLADIIITGVSRTGKTPLSMYLAVLGWKVANVPIVVESPLPEELSKIDRKRVFGLDINHEQLLRYRRKRQERMGISSLSSYTKPETVYNELEYGLDICKEHRFSIINVTNKPIESSAGEIIEMMTDRFSQDSSYSFE